MEAKEKLNGKSATVHSLDFSNSCPKRFATVPGDILCKRKKRVLLFRNKALLSSWVLHVHMYVNVVQYMYNGTERNGTVHSVFRKTEQTLCSVSICEKRKLFWGLLMYNMYVPCESHRYNIYMYIHNYIDREIGRLTQLGWFVPTHHQHVLSLYY